MDPPILVCKKFPTGPVAKAGAQMRTIRVSGNGQIAIPTDIRKKMRIKRVIA